jgi:hypothetical protein
MATKHHHKYNTGWLILAGVLIAVMVVLLSENVRSATGNAVAEPADLLMYSSNVSTSEHVGVNIQADIYNKGKADVNDPYVVRLEVFDQTTKKFIYIEDKTFLPTHFRNSFKSARFFWIPDAKGEYDFRLYADYNNELAEPDEENNIFLGHATVEIFNSGIADVTKY